MKSKRRSTVLAAERVEGFVATITAYALEQSAPTVRTALTTYLGVAVNTTGLEAI